MRASQWSFTGGQLLRFRIDRQWEACPSFPFSAPFHRIGRNATLRPLIRQGRAGWGRPCRLQQRCMLDDTLMIHLSLWNRPRVVMRYAASIVRDGDHLLPHPQWAMGSEGHPFNCLPKINSLLELHCHQRRNQIVLEWRQKTFTFVRYDYGCSLVPPVVIKESQWFSPSFIFWAHAAPPPLHLNLLLLVSWHFIARLLVLFLSIAAGYTFCILCVYRYPHMKHLLSTL